MTEWYCKCPRKVLAVFFSLRVFSRSPSPGNHEWMIQVSPLTFPEDSSWYACMLIGAHSFLGGYVNLTFWLRVSRNLMEIKLHHRSWITQPHEGFCASLWVPERRWRGGGTSISTSKWRESKLGRDWQKEPIKREAAMALVLQKSRLKEFKYREHRKWEIW